MNTTPECRIWNNVIVVTATSRRIAHHAHRHYHVGYHVITRRECRANVDCECRHEKQVGGTVRRVYHRITMSRHHRMSPTRHNKIATGCENNAARVTAVNTSVGKEAVVTPRHEVPGRNSHRVTIQHRKNNRRQ